MRRTVVLIFAKYPEPGAVKTRMVPPLTARQAAELHITSLRAVCELVTDRLDRPLSAVLVVTPDDRLCDFRTLVSDMDDYWEQGQGDLGARLTRACDRAFEGGADAVLLLGADSPTLPPSRLDDAVAALTDHDAVLGPCDDGGYYLLALRRPLPALFRRIDWGSERVADQTRLRARESGITLRELDPWYDLDRFEDLRRAQHDSRSVDERSRPAHAALRRLIDTHLEHHD